MSQNIQYYIRIHSSPVQHSVVSYRVASRRAVTHQYVFAHTYIHNISCIDAVYSMTINFYMVVNTWLLSRAQHTYTFYMKDTQLYGSEATVCRDRSNIHPSERRTRCLRRWRGRVSAHKRAQWAVFPSIDAGHRAGEGSRGGRRYMKISMSCMLAYLRGTLAETSGMMTGHAQITCTWTYLRDDTI